MASAFPWEDHTLRYKCKVCGHVLNAADFDLCTYYNDEIHQHLLDRCDLYGMSENQDDIRVKMRVPLIVNCANSECDSNIGVIAKVEAAPVWLGRGESLDVDTFELVQANVIEFCKNQPIEELQLRIVCKTTMGMAASCYLGYNEETRKLYRPIRGAYEANFSWPNASNKFKVGAVYRFSVLANNDSSEYCPSDFPHQNEDLAVDDHEENITAIDMQSSWSPSILERIATSSIFDIFPEESIEEMKYIEEGTDCPSAGVLIVNEDNINVYENFEKNRVCIRNVGESFDFPLKATSFERPKHGGVRKALILLGLGRPFAGDCEVYDPARCYILALAIYLY